MSTCVPRARRVAASSAALLILAVATLVLPAPAARAAGPDVGGITAGVRETRLSNGLRVLTKEVRRAPVVSVSVWYPVGSRNERAGATGVSHLLEHLMFKGTKTYRVGEIARALFVNGATFNASTYYDWTAYHETLAADRLELALAIEADRMLNSRIEQADLDAEMTVVRSELEGRENNPGGLLWQAVVSTAFWAHPYHWPVIGWRSDVENVPRDAIYRYYKTYYGPNDATLVLVGDFDTDAVLALVRKHFGSIPPIPAPPPVYTTEPEQRGERRVTIRRAGSLPLVTIAYRAPGVTSPDFYALEVLAMVLGEGRTSRLYQGLVERQLASRADAGAPTLRDPFLFFVSAASRPGVTADKLESALLDEIERVRSAPVSADELARAKSRIEADFVFRADSVSSQGRQLGAWAMIADWRDLATYLDRIRALTPEEVQRVAARYLVADTRTVGQFIPTADAAPAGPPGRESSTRVERPRPGDRPVAIPAPSPVSPAPRRVTRFALDNGISVVVQENPATPTFSIRGSLLAGGVVEPHAKQGLAQITAAMLTRGTATRNALEFAAALEDVGASLDASGGALTVTLSARALSRDFERVTELLTEMLTEPTFPGDELDRVKGQYLAALKRAQHDPGSLASVAFDRAVYPEGSPLRPETYAAAERTLAGISRDDVVGFYRRQYGPDGMILVVAGDVSAARVRRALAARLAAWPRNPQARPVPTLDVPLQPQPVRQVIPVPDKSQATVLWGHAGGLRRSDPDFYATQVLNVILGSGSLTSRLGTAIRDERGLAYSVGSGFDASLYPGPFRISLGTNPANVGAAVTTLEAEVRRIREHGVTQREVDEAVAFLTGRLPLGLETNRGVAGVLWAMEFYRLGPDYLDRYGDDYRAVSVAAVGAAARRHLHPDRATLVVSGTVPADLAP